MEEHKKGRKSISFSFSFSFPLSLVLDMGITYCFYKEFIYFSMELNKGINSDDCQLDNTDLLRVIC